MKELIELHKEDIEKLTPEAIEYFNSPESIGVHTRILPTGVYSRYFFRLGKRGKSIKVYYEDGFMERKFVAKLSINTEYQRIITLKEDK